MTKNTDKNISKNLSGKYSEKLIDYTNKSVTKILKSAFKKIIKTE